MGRRSWFGAALLLLALPGCELLLDAGDRRLAGTSSISASGSDSTSSSSSGGGGAGGAGQFDFTIHTPVVRLTATTPDTNVATLTITHGPGVEKLKLSVEEFDDLAFEGIHVEATNTDDTTGELTFSTSAPVKDRHVALHVKLTDGTTSVVHPLDLVLAGPPGKLDGSFGVGGEYVSDQVGSRANALVLAPNDELLVAGNLAADGLLVRFDPDGLRQQQTVFDATGAPMTTTANTLAIAPDGIVYVGGEVDDKPYLQRFEGDAKLGAAVVGGTSSSATSIVLPQNGASVHLYGLTTATQKVPFGLRAPPDLSTSFDILGDWSATSFGGLALAKDGASYWLVGAGHPGLGDQTFQVFAARYSAAGIKQGQAKYFAPTVDSAKLDIGATALGGNGPGERLYAGGGKGDTIFLAAILTSSAELDLQFGAGGIWTKAVGRMAGILPLPNGKIICVGSTGMSGFTQRLDADGAGDASFGEPLNDGWVIDNHPGSDHTAVIADRFGRIVVAGSIQLNGEKLILQRYWL